jgi:hypothetical protein
MRIRRWIATGALILGLLAGGLMATVPEASADCFGNLGNSGGNNVGVGSVGNDNDCSVFGSG